MKRPLEMAHDFLAEVVTQDDIEWMQPWEMVMTRFF